MNARLPYQLPFRLFAGELHNSSASSLEYLERTVWPSIADLHLNTIIAPVAWEDIEPTEGTFDFSLVSELYHWALQHQLRLVILWFASWKNGESHYAPSWVLKDWKRFPRVQMRPGHASETLTPLAEATVQADARAYRALLQHFRTLEGERALTPERTVLFVQLENEIGVLGASRDFSPAANAAFLEPVPQPLLEALNDPSFSPRPEIAAARGRYGSWADVFGPCGTHTADEAFMAWHYARFVHRVHAAGNEVYPLPAYVNAWLVQYDGEVPGRYPSGGPVPRMADLWHLAAPTLFTLAPDIYLPTFQEVCQDYASLGTPLVIPELISDLTAAAKTLYAFGEHHALCVAPFGIDSMTSQRSPTDTSAPLRSRLYAETCQTLSQMGPFLNDLLQPNLSRGFLQQSDAPIAFSLGDVTFRLEWSRPLSPNTPPGALLIALDSTDHSFWLIGSGLSLAPVDGPNNLCTRILSHIDGRFENARFIRIRRLNGDERPIRLPLDAISTRHIQLYQFC